ncbi:VOC family protein [Parabacteroides sp.]|uniref:VOC family protein n=1 Tax=Parabacteroides sp. TaxID=1869337 RepID=UPI00257E50B0|nr:VOC family protein [Parabacteroides sp.]
MLPEFRFHHIGVAVFDIDTTAKFYMDAGYSTTVSVLDPLQDIRICFLTKPGMPMVELLEAVDSSSPVNRILKSVGVSPYHLCYEVSDMEDALGRLRKMRFVIVSNPVEACALDNRRVCFVYNKNMGLIELLEEVNHE